MTLRKGEPIFAHGSDLSDLKFDPVAIRGMWRGERENCLEIVIEQDEQEDHPLRELVQQVVHTCQVMGHDLKTGEITTAELIEYLDDKATQVALDQVAQGESDFVQYCDADVPTMLAAILVLIATQAVPSNEHYCVTLIRDGRVPYIPNAVH